MMNNIRSPNFPKVPLLTEVGYNGPPSRSWYGIFAPAGTPRPVVDKLHAALLAALASPETRQRMLDAGVSIATSRTQEDFASFVGIEMTRWGAIARDSGATID